MDVRRLDELLRHGVGVYFQNDNINTFDKDAELRLTIMSSIAQDEVRKLSERTRFGFKRAQENGVLLGQNNLFGYNKVDGHLEIVEREAAVVREVFERNETCNEQLAALEQQRDSLKNADKTLAERIRRVENLRGAIERQWQENCGFSREMAKALVDHIVVDADESKTKITLDICLTMGKEYRADYVRPQRKNGVLSFDEMCL